MTDALIFFAEGTEECEMLIVVDMLRRAGLDIKIVSVTGNLNVTSSHGVTIKADQLVSEADFENARMIILPGGMPGTLNLKNCKALTDEILDFYKKGKYLAAVCAAPTILSSLGILKGRKATCFPGKVEELKAEGADYEEVPVAVDGKIITSRGLGTTIDFAAAIITALESSEKADEIKKKIVYNGGCHE